MNGDDRWFFGDCPTSVISHHAENVRDIGNSVKWCRGGSPRVGARTVRGSECKTRQDKKSREAP